MKKFSAYHVSNHTTRFYKINCIRSIFLILIIVQLFFSVTVDAKITYWLDESALNSSKKDQIIAAMDSCVNAYNAFSNYDDNVKVIYDASIPTANAGYQGRIAFGGSISARVAIHEMAHVLGCGTISKWNENRNTSTNKWTGSKALAQLAVFDGDDAVLNADKWHFWPYGLNTKWDAVERHVYMVGALREDMGLSNTSGQGTHTNIYIKHKSSGKLLYNDGSAYPVEVLSSTGGANYQWNFIPVGGDLTHFRLEHDASTRWLHCMEDGASTFELGPISWTGERTRWKLVSIADDTNHMHILHKASGKWLHAASDGSNLILESTTSTGDDSRWQIIYNNSNPIVNNKQYRITNNKILIHPNPAKTQFTLLGIEENITISIYNSQGQLVKQVLSTKGLTKVNTSDVNNGLYFVTFSDTNIPTQKLVVR